MRQVESIAGEISQLDCSCLSLLVACALDRETDRSFPFPFSTCSSSLIHMMSSPWRRLLPLLPLLISLTAAQLMPDNPCAAYFQYVQAGSIQGELTLPLQNGRNRIDVRFSQRGDQSVRSHLSLSLSSSLGVSPNSFRSTASCSWSTGTVSG